MKLSGRKDAERPAGPKIVATGDAPVAQALAISLVLLLLFAVVVERPLYSAHLEAADARFRFRDALANASLTFLLVAKSLALLAP